MKLTSRASFLLIVTVAFNASIAQTLSTNNAEPESPSEKSDVPVLGYIGAGLSIANGSFNDYKVGNANQFYQYLTGDPTLKLDDGAIGFKYVSFGVISPMGKSKSFVFGAEFALILSHASRAISGTNHGLTSTGANMNFGMKMIDVSLRAGVKLDGKGSNISLEAGGGMAFMSGKIAVYGSGGNEWEQKGAYGNPIRGGLSLDFVVGKKLIINARMGYRILLIDEVHKDPTTGKKVSFYVNGTDGDIVKVDWSGKYASVGLGIVINSKKE